MIHRPFQVPITIAVLAVAVMFAGKAWAQVPDVLLHHGKIVTVNSEFRIVEAMSIRGERIVATGTNDDIRKLAGDDTRQIDLQGRMVLPGLMDSHVHAPDAAVYEFEHPIPDMQTVADVVAYVRERAKARQPGEWIVIQQVFVTRLLDQRFPTRQELDDAAPDNPVMFRTGPDCSLNSLALKLSGIDRDFQITDGQSGKVERDNAGEPTGILRGLSRFVKVVESEKSPTFDERVDALRKLLADYNSVGLTSISDRNTSAEGIKAFEALKADGTLSCRAFLCRAVNANDVWEDVEQTIREAAAHPAHAYDSMLWLRGVKCFLDGGMLTGSAYLRQPWGVSKIYAISDPEYRGVRNIDPDRLYRVAKLCLENDLQFTAHAVGDGAVHGLIDAYRRVNADFLVAKSRPCITHCNFMSAEAIDQMRELGIVADLQPVWLWLDGRTLSDHFGSERLTWFQPYRTIFDKGVIVGGGSDHMQKVGSLRSINPYNPFLGMWIAVQRQARRLDEPLHPEQRISREEAIRLYTINNAFLMFDETNKGSLEPGKLADFIVVDRDLLTCEVDELRETQVQQTWLGGRVVYQSPQSP
jgi:predicted amidohydrolase YtcJ